MIKIQNDDTNCIRKRETVTDVGKVFKPFIKKTRNQKKLETFSDVVSSLFFIVFLFNLKDWRKHMTHASLHVTITTTEPMF